tara:strand:- start:112 stop:357 length:246 start_codon:yes stop_codon:yes gene_type:complete
VILLLTISLIFALLSLADSDLRILSDLFIVKFYLLTIKIQETNFSKPGENQTIYIQHLTLQTLMITKEILKYLEATLKIPP